MDLCNHRSIPAKLCGSLGVQTPFPSAPQASQIPPSVSAVEPYSSYWVRILCVRDEQSAIKDQGCIWLSECIMFIKMCPWLVTASAGVLGYMDWWTLIRCPLGNLVVRPHVHLIKSKRLSTLHHCITLHQHRGLDEGYRPVTSQGEHSFFQDWWNFSLLQADSQGRIGRAYKDGMCSGKSFYYRTRKVLVICIKMWSYSLCKVQNNIHK